jgi:Carboxypeptidase regulatory-like domain
MRHRYLFFATIVSTVLCVAGRAQQATSSSPTVGDANQNMPATVKAQALLPSAPEPRDKSVSPGDMEPGEVNGTVTDVNGDLVPGATVVLDGAGPADRRKVAANDSAFFQFGGLTPGVPYHLTISANGFENWVSAPITLTSGQFFDVTGIKLKLEPSVSSVTVYSSTEQIATQQVRLAEQQRVLGLIPNFYVVYDSKNAVPITTKLKFQMAYRVSIDPVSIIGAATLAGINQAADRPDYQQGALGYAQRFGAAYADGVTDIMFGGAILPSLLHQDPRYFYQGTGTVKSRMLHAVANPFICRGDNGKSQPNYSSIGGDLISSAISNTYYPQSNRGAGLVFENLALSTAERTISSIMQEFVLRKLTPSAK